MQNVFDTGNQNVSKLDQCYLLQTTNNFCEGTAAKRKIYINVNRLYKCSTPRNGETLKQFVGNLLTNCLSVFDHFVGLALKGLNRFFPFRLFPVYFFSFFSFVILLSKKKKKKEGKIDFLKEYKAFASKNKIMLLLLSFQNFDPPYPDRDYISLTEAALQVFRVVSKQAVDYTQSLTGVSVANPLNNSPQEAYAWGSNSNRQLVEPNKEKVVTPTKSESFQKAVQVPFPFLYKEVK